MANVTAKVKVTNMTSLVAGQQTLSFSPDYNDERNKEWAVATPALSLSMSVKEEVAGHFKVGQAYTLTFSPEEE